MHQLDEFKKALVELQKRGVLFCCNKNTNGNLIVLPEEIKPYVKEVLEIELREEAYKNLLNQLTTQQLFTALKSSDLFVSGTKEERISRIIKSGLQPSEVLDALSATDIHEICKKLKGIKTSGSKNDRINRIINYFSSMSNKEPQVNEDKRSLYYQYFEELASRDNKELYGKKIINRDIDIEKFFEEATHYLFEEKLGLELMQLQGNEHADGCIAMKKDEILLWDNKSKEKLYEFPASHYKQFRRYIRESAKRVNTFLIIVSDVNEKKVKDQATRLSWESNTKTDIAIIRAGDLKHIAEKWKSFVSKKNTLFDPIVFSYTGVLSRSQLENNLKLL